MAVWIKNILWIVVFCIFSIAGLAQDADFTANNTTGCDNLVVQFKADTTGNQISWLWDLGDGSSNSTLQNPWHFYSATGEYTVSLTVTYASGEDTETKINYISIYGSPICDFSIDVFSGCPPLTVNFTDNSTSGDETVISWLWDFGNGSTSTEQNPVHTYTSQGNFNISLFVTDENGCTDEKIMTNVITVLNAPLADFDISDSIACVSPLTVTITNNSSGTGITGYSWDFGDGDTDNAEDPPPHTYYDFGEYTISLIVLNTASCNDTAYRTVRITQYVADFFGDTLNDCAPFSAHFTDISSDVPNSWEWNFGDGQGNSSSQNPDYTYDVQGNYTVTLISGNAYGCSDTMIKQDYITVYPDPVINYFIADSTACMIPFTVSFTDTTDGAISWSWDFGDGNVSAEQNPVHTYQDTGVFDISLTVINETGCSANIIDTGLIRIIELVAEFTDTTISGEAEPYKGCKPLTVSFTDLSFSNEEITSWHWDFGDGSSVDTNQSTIDHIYSDTGSYTVTLIIINIDGCTDSITHQDIVLVGQPPVTNFAPKDTTGCHPFEVQFTDSSSVYTDEWEWSFGSTSQDPLYTFSDTGYFDVSLITSFHGCPDTLSFDSAVHVLVPKALFTADTMVGCDTPHVVNFTDNSYDPTSWEWDFGDGSPVCTDSFAVHTYTDYGFYDAMLVVGNSNTGCSDTIIKTIRLPDTDPGFIQDTIAGCEDLTISFTDTSQSTTNITLWKWDFGGGAVIGFGNGDVEEQNTTGTYDSPEHTYTGAGIYTVKLYTYEQYGCTDSIIKTNLIDVKKLPSPQFSTDTTFGCLPLEVEFIDHTETPPAIVSWLWEFGDGNISTEQDTTVHIYDETGVYNASLTITDTFNCINTFYDSIDITVTFPSPDFTYDNIICNNETVSYNNTSVGSDLAYIWNYGDGSPNDTTSQTTTIHYYSVDSDTGITLDVVLTAIDTNGCTDSITKQLLISIPKAEFTADSTNAACPPFIVNFTDSSLGNVTDWIWDFGDNTITSSIQNPAHTYSVAGYFDVSQIVATQYGCTDTIIKDSLIHVNGPMGTFTYIIDSSICNWEITFLATTQNTISIYWIFGDGGTATGDSVVYIYYTSGNYTPTMIIQNAAGCQVEIESEEELVIQTPDLVLSFNTTEENCNSSDGSATAIPSGGPEPYTYEWDNDKTTATITDLESGVYHITVTDDLGCFIIDSVTIIAVFPDIYLSFIPTDAVCTTPNGTARAVVDSGGTPPHTFMWSTGETADSISGLTAATYYITVTDNNGCSDTDSVTINTTINEIEIGFNTTDALCLTNNGTATAFVLSGGTLPYNYFWADSTTNETIIELVSEMYYVTITSSLGCIGNDSAIVGQSINDLTPLFSMNNNNVYCYVPITFTPELIETDTNIVEWIWYFGDGDTLSDSSGNPVTHLFNTSGDFDVVMHITDSYGCTESLSQTVRIKEGFEIPNVFTPNGDGNNDAFIIHGSGIEEITLMIFNRWGEIMMQRTSASYISWDGRTTAGVEASHGTYFYIIEATYTDGTEHDFKGFLTLFR